MEDVKTSGASESVSDQKEKDKVAYETYLRVLDEKKKTQEKLKQEQEEKKAMTEKLAQFENEKKQLEEQKLIEKGDLQKLIELREKELQERELKLKQIESEKEEIRQAYVDRVKLEAFYTKLPGKITDPDHLKLAKLDDIIINPETGEIDNKSVENVVSDYVKRHGKLIDVRQSMFLPNGAAQSSNSLSPESFKKLSLKDMKKNAAEAVRLQKQKLGV